MLKLGLIVNSLEELITQDELFFAWTLIKIVGRVLLIAHWFACFYFLIGDQESYQNVWNVWLIKTEK